MFARIIQSIFQFGVAWLAATPSRLAKSVTARLVFKRNSFMQAGKIFFMA